jgi:MFS family permease
MLVIGSILMTGAGLSFAFTNNFLSLVIAGTIGVVSPSGNEVGPFLSIEQAALSHVVSPSMRTSAFARYTLTGSFATAIGSLCGGVLPSLVDSSGATPINGYRAVVVVYAVLGMVLTLVFAQLSSATEVGASEDRLSGLAAKKTLLGIGHSREIVFRLSRLFALDSFSGGFVVQSFAAYWFYLRFGVKPAALGVIFFGANLFAGVSALLASRLASWIGLVRTMVFTHLPSNVLLILQSEFYCCGSASAKWTFRRGSPTRWQLFVPKSDLPQPASREWREQLAPPSRRCLSGSCLPSRD